MLHSLHDSIECPASSNGSRNSCDSLAAGAGLALGLGLVGVEGIAVGLVVRRAGRTEWCDELRASSGEVEVGLSLWRLVVDSTGLKNE